MMLLEGSGTHDDHESKCCMCLFAAAAANVVALQVSWLLLALLQDQPGNRHIRIFKDACERAALTGTWVSTGHRPH